MRRLAMVAVIVALCTPSITHAQTKPITTEMSGSVPTQGIWLIDPGTLKWQLWQTDGTGAAKVFEEFPEASYLKKYQNWMQTKLVPGNKDSTEAKDFLGANHIFIGVHYTFQQGGTTGNDSCFAALCFLKVQSGYLQSTDTLSSFRRVPRGRAIPAQFMRGAAEPDTVYAATTDSIGSFLELKNAYPAATTARQIGEIPIVLMGGTYGNRNFFFELRDPETGLPIVGPFISFTLRLAETYDYSLAPRVTDTNVAIQIDGWGTR